MLTVVAKIKVKQEAIDLVKAEMLKMAAETVKESGCVIYKLHQDNTDSSVFIFYENWFGEEALQNHLKSEHVQAYLKATKGQIAEFVMNKLTQLS